MTDEEKNEEVVRAFDLPDEYSMLEIIYGLIKRIEALEAK